MAVTVFKDASYNLAGLLSRIEHGEIARFIMINRTMMLN